MASSDPLLQTSPSHQLSLGTSVSVPPLIPATIMVSRRAYQTEQERRAAHNASSRQSYQKHRHAINQRRRKSYQLAGISNNRTWSHLEPLIQRVARCTDIEVNSGVMHIRHSSDLAEALDQLERLQQRFNMLTENEPHCFVDKIYHAYIATIGPT
ncbi:hypothetical protein EV421DRAFT_1907852 [Armillaria borealis]|uniref:Uncharacterized protein n=1 Tax=Armillaria borealis TaxID=47425 RepID=A0AA39J6Y3_9AGAR|nr:hypothetical protein EV421DRAFT_1907852 [Armillaria borealis]